MQTPTETTTPARRKLALMLAWSPAIEERTGHPLFATVEEDGSNRPLRIEGDFPLNTLAEARRAHAAAGCHLRTLAEEAEAADVAGYLLNLSAIAVRREFLFLAVEAAAEFEAAAAK